MTTHYRTCHLCEAMCGLVLEVDGQKIVDIRGDVEDPLSRGHICPKARALEDIHEDPDRLRAPLCRTETGWEEMSWRQAMSYVGERLRGVRSAHGRDAIAMYLGNPTVHNLGAMLFAPQLARSLRSRNRYSATSVDQLPHQFTSWAMYGHQLLLPVPDIDHTDFLLMFGGNPLASNGSIMSVPDVKKRLAAVRARGGRVVLVDPRRTETARVVDEHIFIRPGTDALMLGAMLRILFDESLISLGHLAGSVSGLKVLREAVEPLTPHKVAPVCGVPSQTLIELTRQFAGASSAVVHGRMGVSTQAFGGLCQWFVQALNVVTGNLDRVGGSMFTTPAVDVLSRLSPGRFGRWKSRVRGLPEFAGELPVSALSEEILTEGPGQIRAMITVAGNPVLSTPNGVQLDQALAGLDFMVSVDPYLNETTRHADVILPPVSPLERPHYDVVFNTLAVRNYARFSPPVFERPAQGRHDWEILSDLHLELLPRQDLRSRAQVRAMRGLGPRGQLDIALRAGPYGSGFAVWKSGLTLSSLEDMPHGMDLGPLRPQLPGLLWTTDKRVHLAPEVVLSDMPRLLSRLAQGEDEGLVLIGRRHVRSCNSWMHNAQRLVRGKERCTLMVHPQDAQRLSLTDGGSARVTSRVGEVVAPVQVTDQVMEGVVSLPHGYGHSRPGVRLAVASEHSGVSVNDLTDPAQVDVLTGNAVLNGVPVTVSAVDLC